MKSPQEHNYRDLVLSGESYKALSDALHGAPDGKALMLPGHPDPYVFGIRIHQEDDAERRSLKAMQIAIATGCNAAFENDNGEIVEIGFRKSDH